MKRIKSAARWMRANWSGVLLLALTLFMLKDLIPYWWQAIVVDKWEMPHNMGNGDGP